MLQSKLQKFGLDLCGDIVAICTDGASVMCKVGKLIKAEQQLCYAHGIQLAVIDVLYKKRSSSTRSGGNDDVVDTTGCGTEMESNKSTDDNDQEEECEGELQIEMDDIDELEIIELSEQYQQAVEKVRTLVKIFRRSPTKDDAVLQKYVKEEAGKELNLILDCRTRWNSLLSTLSRFHILHNPIQKALIDLKISIHMSA